MYKLRLYLIKDRLISVITEYCDYSYPSIPEVGQWIDIGEHVYKVIQISHALNENVINIYIHAFNNREQSESELYEIIHKLNFKL